MEEKQGAMTEAVYYILLSLQTPKHGYGIIQHIRELTGGRLVMGAGTLYGAVNTLLEKGWIRLYSEDKQSRKKKEYVITEYGIAALRREISRLEELLQNGRLLMQPSGAYRAVNSAPGERGDMNCEEVQVVF